MELERGFVPWLSTFVEVGLYFNVVKIELDVVHGSKTLHFTY